ncbi:unnamed protein product [Ambrosiozyma monospora]|uniref:Unnamed protein product n=1 Tax=Ambrosiozyma monospora TaxID=43982 RepID=A0ACB5TBU4_AMBMO|nr:unnamed protein product [Ambrosiozyma monospora]
MTDLIASPLFPVEELSSETLVKLPPKPNAESASVKLYVVQAEPIIFLQGFSDSDLENRPPSILRGCLFIRVTKPVKIKSISLRLTGIQRTEWPEGIPPKKVDHCEVNHVIQHTWPFFNYQNVYPVTANSRNNADFYIPKKDADPDITSFTLDNSLTPVTTGQDSSIPSPRPALNPLSPIKSTSSIVSAAFKTIGRSASAKASSTVDLDPIKSNNSMSLSAVSTTTNSDENKLFLPGDYIYSFEQPLRSNLPETTKVTFGSTTYYLDASLERSGTFKTSLTARRPVTIIRAPSQESSEENEPIIINRDWEDQLKYECPLQST